MTAKPCPEPLTCTSTTCAASSSKHQIWNQLAPSMEWATALKFELLGRLWVRLLLVTLTPVIIAVLSVALLANYVTIGQFESFLQQDVQQRDDRLEVVLERYYQEQASWQGVGNTIQRMAA